MTNKLPKIKWKVSEPPTGRYRSFFRRGWPSCEYENGNICAMIDCEDDYYPSDVKAGNHKELTLKIAHYGKPSNPPHGLTWVRGTKKYATLKEAKEGLIEILKENPQLLPT